MTLWADLLFFRPNALPVRVIRSIAALYGVYTGGWHALRQPMW
jgi:hypothetical protein